MRRTPDQTSERVLGPNPNLCCQNAQRGSSRVSSSGRLVERCDVRVQSFSRTRLHSGLAVGQCPVARHWNTATPPPFLFGSSNSSTLTPCDSSNSRAEREPPPPSPPRSPVCPNHSLPPAAGADLGFMIQNVILLSNTIDRGREG